LSEAQQQLTVLSTHIDALMVGFAVQALQAAGDPARQQTIHMQALAEQQKVRMATS
jgi:alkylation response protein AidB-like acyl-CoA dehydrogenase